LEENQSFGCLVKEKRRILTGLPNLERLVLTNFNNEAESSKSVSLKNRNKV